MERTGAPVTPVAPAPKRSLWGTLIAPGRDPLALLQGLAREYGDVRFKLGGERAFLLNHPQYIRDVLARVSEGGSPRLS